MSLGAYHTCVILIDGKYKCWGKKNTVGSQLELPEKIKKNRKKIQLEKANLEASYMPKNLKIISLGPSNN